MSESESPPPPTLDAIQARVLGCLIEKEATTPDTYPLTVNAAQVAANQKTAREPVMSLETGDVHRALRLLESIGLARQQFSSRAERYEHRLDSALAMTRQQVVLLGLLLLRGAQTVHELYARSERLLRFTDAEEVRHHLDRLVQRQFVVVLPRGSGQREDRYMHLLAGPVDMSPPPGDAEPVAKVDAGLEARVRALEAQVAQLQQELAQLRGGSASAGDAD